MREVMVKKYLFLIVALLGSFHAIAKDDDTDFAISVMIVSKTTGMCGAISQMTKFQESTQLSGGDEFIERFIKSELGRLDMTAQEFVDSCSKSIESYNTLKNTLESSRKNESSK